MKKPTCLPVLSAFAAALILCCAVPSLAQNREKFVISAKAGGINAITGQATVHSKGYSDWQTLMITDDLNAGDRVRTGYDGRVEILLNPGSYLRVGSNSEVELSDNSLSNLEVRLSKGTAIFEATGADGLELNISISTPHTKIAIVRQGLYRLSVLPGDATELIVRKGRVILSDSQTKIKDGNKVVFHQTNVSVAKLTKEEKKREEDIDAWSKERAETLAKANRRVTGRMMASAFASYTDRFDPSLRRGSGLWFYNSRLGYCTFIPWYYGWRSPYGSYYSNYNPYLGNGYTGGGQASGGQGSGNQGGGYSNGGGGSTSSTPPATGSNGGGRPVAPSGGYGNGNSGGARQHPMPSQRIESDTGRPMPRKSLEISRPN